MSVEKNLAQNVLQTVKTGLWNKYKPYIIGGGLILLVIGGILLFHGCKKEPAQPVTLTSQETAQTPQGVTAAANNAQVPISEAQAKDIADKILAAAGKKPDSFINTTGANLQTAAETALSQSGGDFAMITDPNHPNQTPTILNTGTNGNTANSISFKDITGSQSSPIKPDDKIVLNQYNIEAYPKTLTVGHIGMYSAGVERLNKVNIGSIPLFLPHGGVGYAGPYIGVTHDRFKKVDHFDVGLAGAF